MKSPRLAGKGKSLVRENAETNLGVSDDGKFLRTALLIGDEITSVDVMKNGVLVCRLNITVSEHKEHAIVDVIGTDKAKMRVLAWDSGAPVLRQGLPRPLVSIDMDNWK